MIVNADNEVMSTAYNGPPAGHPADTSVGCTAWCARAQHFDQLGIDAFTDDDVVMSYRRCPSLHAEANALLQADRSRINGGTIYVSSAVCMDCAKLIANSGLARVIMCVYPTDRHRDPMAVAAYLATCGLEVISHDVRYDVETRQELNQGGT